jgi:hypothetical protein
MAPRHPSWHARPDASRGRFRPQSRLHFASAYDRLPWVAQFARDNFAAAEAKRQPPKPRVTHPPADTDQFQSPTGRDWRNPSASGMVG